MTTREIVIVCALTVAAIVQAIVALQAQRHRAARRRLPRTLQEHNERRSRLPEMRTARTDRAARAARLPNRRPELAIDDSKSEPRRRA